MASVHSCSLDESSEGGACRKEQADWKAGVTAQSDHAHCLLEDCPGGCAASCKSLPCEVTAQQAVLDHWQAAVPSRANLPRHACHSPFEGGRPDTQVLASVLFLCTCSRFRCLRASAHWLRLITHVAPCITTPGQGEADMRDHHGAHGAGDPPSRQASCILNGRADRVPFPRASLMPALHVGWRPAAHNGVCWRV